MAPTWAARCNALWQFHGNEAVSGERVKAVLTKTGQMGNKMGACQKTGQGLSLLMSLPPLSLLFVGNAHSGRIGGREPLDGGGCHYENHEDSKPCDELIVSSIVSHVVLTSNTQTASCITGTTTR